MKNYDIDKMNRLIDANGNKELVIFVGSGVSVNSGYPSWGKMIKKMGEELNIDTTNLDSSDYLKIPEILSAENENEYKKIIQSELDLDKNPNEINDLISKLKPDHIITTNYDNLIEKSLAENGLGEIYGVVYDDKSFMEQGKKKNNYVIKMHGDIKHLDSIVLKEKDYLDFESKKPMIANFINSLLATHIFLFIGYSLSDSTLKTIINNISNFKDKFNIKGLSKNIMAGFFDKKRYGYDLESDYFKQRDVELINLDNFYSKKSEKYDKLISFLTEINNGVLTDIGKSMLVEYSNQNYVSFRDINNCLMNIPDSLLDDSADDINIIDEKAYNFFFKSNNILNKEVLRKTIDYKIAIRNKESYKIISSEVYDEVYKMIFNCEYDKLFNYYLNNKKEMYDNEYYFLYNLFHENSNEINNKKIIDHRRSKGLSNRMILMNNKKELGLPTNTVELSSKQRKITYFLEKVLGGHVIDNELYEQLYNQSREMYGLDTNMFFSFRNVYFYKENYGKLRNIKKIAYDLYRYTTINRIINKIKNRNVYYLFLNCILITYHKKNDLNNITKYDSDYKLSATDIDLVVKNMSYSNIVKEIKKNNIDYLRIDNIHGVVNNFVNLCKSFVFLEKNNRKSSEKTNLCYRLLDYIQSYITFISLDNSLKNNDLERIYNSIISLEEYNFTNKLFSTFEHEFLSRLSINKYVDFKANNILVNKIVNMNICRSILPGYDNLAFANIRKIMMGEKYNLDIIKKNFDSDNLNPNYLCLFLPIVYSKEKIKSMDNWIIDVLKYQPIYFIILICDEGLLKDNIDKIMKDSIKECYRPNSMDSYSFNNLLAYLDLKSLGAHVEMPDVLKVSKNDKYKINRIVSFVLDDKNFDFSTIDITNEIWKNALLDDIQFKRFVLTNILKKHINEVLSKKIIFKFRRGILTQKEMIILNGLDVTLYDLLDYSKNNK